MKLFQFLDGLTPAIGLIADKTINLSVSLQWYRQIALGEPSTYTATIDDLLQQSRDIQSLCCEVMDFLETHDLASKVTIDMPSELQAPLKRPGKIIAIGKNYEKHARETNSEPPAKPMYFNKLAECIVGPGEKIILPPSIGRVDPELELAVVIGKPSVNICEKEALQYVAGYSILNDVTARDLQQEAKDNRYPWFASKNFLTFCPIGPYLTLTDEIEDPNNLEMTLRVNGEVRQKENTSQMIFSAAKLISVVSHHLPLNPGDIIATGTPHGIAPIQAGDRLEMEIERIGVLYNSVSNAN